MLKKIKIVFILLAISLFAFNSLSQQADANANQQAPHRAELIGMGASMSERLGADDKPALVVHFVGEMHGSLETCGWKGPGFGGLARRVSYIKLFKEKFNNVPTLLVDSGNVFAEDRTKHGETRVDGVAKNEWMLKAQDQFRVDVVNLSAGDIGYLAKSLTKSEFARRGESQPVFKRFISANIKSEAKDFTNPPPFMVREVPQVNSAKPVRVAFIGLSEIAPTTDRIGKACGSGSETKRRDCDCTGPTQNRFSGAAGAGSSRHRCHHHRDRRNLHPLI
jgi:2',3'-cyclic-nucleotide 2'-phosphodiesterase (5'-nucleotidase family)